MKELATEEKLAVLEDDLTLEFQIEPWERQ